MGLVYRLSLSYLAMYIKPHFFPTVLAFHNFILCYISGFLWISARG